MEKQVLNSLERINCGLRCWSRSQEEPAEARAGCHPGQIQHFKSLYKVLESKEEPVLQRQIGKHVVATQDENLKHGCEWTSLGKPTSLSDGLIFMVLQRPEASSQTNDL